MREGAERTRHRSATADSLQAEAGAQVEEAADGWGAESRRGKRRDDRAAGRGRRTTVALATGCAGERSTGAMGIRKGRSPKAPAVEETPTMGHGRAAGATRMGKGTAVGNGEDGPRRPAHSGAVRRGSAAGAWGLKRTRRAREAEAARSGKGEGAAHADTHKESQHKPDAAASTTPTASAEGDPRSAARAKPATAQAAKVRASAAMSVGRRERGASTDEASSLTLDSPARPATIGSARTDGALNVSRTDGRRQNRSAGTGLRRLGATVRQTSAQHARVLARHSPHRACSFGDDADGDGAGGDRSAPSPSGLTSRASCLTQRMIHSRVAARSSPGYRTSRSWGRCGARLPARLAGRLGA